jgi:hypothetical protein
MYNEELHNFYALQKYLGKKTRRIKWAEHVARTGDIKIMYSILSGIPVGVRLFCSPNPMQGSRHSSNG